MELIPGGNDKISLRILDVMKKLRVERKNYEFVGIEKRFQASNISFLITKNNKDIGFIYLTDEQKPGMLFLDISILRSYRAMGIGYEAIKEAMRRYNNCGIKQFVIAEVDNDNEACLRVMEKLGAVEITERHFLLQPERLLEFRKFIIEESVDLMEITPKIKDIIELLHEKNGDNENPKVKKIFPIKNDK